MTEEHKLMLCILFIVAAIIVIARYPAMLAAFTRKATARCRDGSLSFSLRPCGTCSHHRGVAEWLPA
jgi:hypothetical protein